MCIISGEFLRPVPREGSFISPINTPPSIPGRVYATPARTANVKLTTNSALLRRLRLGLNHFKPRSQHMN